MGLSICDLKHKVALGATLCFKIVLAVALADVYCAGCG